MIDIHYTEEFARRYQELPPAIQRKAERREKLLRENPFHPGIKTEKLQPLKTEYWSFRIDRSYRIIFRSEGTDRVRFMTCLHPHWIYRYLLAH